MPVVDLNGMGLCHRKVYPFPNANSSWGFSCKGTIVSSPDMIPHNWHSPGTSAKSLGSLTLRILLPHPGKIKLGSPSQIFTKLERPSRMHLQRKQTLRGWVLPRSSHRQMWSVTSHWLLTDVAEKEEMPSPPVHGECFSFWGRLRAVLWMLHWLFPLG